jgi:acetyl esterase
VALHPQARAALEAWVGGPHVTDPGYEVAEQRRLMLEEAAAEPREDVARVEDVDADGVPCRLFVPDGHVGVVVYLHGGGFVFGELDTHDAHARRLANRTGSAVLLVHYRRPPEDPFPAAPDDTDTALRWLLAHGPSRGLDVSRVAAVGDSAGANLALVAALRNPGALTALVLVYPFVDPHGRFDSYRREAAGFGAEEADWYWQQYAARPEDRDDPDLAPIDSPRLGTVPPTLVIAAEHDPLVDEDVELARRIGAAGATVALSTYDGMVHGFWRNPAVFDAAEDAMAEVVDFVHRAF